MEAEELAIQKGKTMYTKTLRNLEADYDEMPLEDQLRVTAVDHPTLTTNEIIVLTNTRAVSTRRRRGHVPERPAVSR